MRPSVAISVTMIHQSGDGDGSGFTQGFFMIEPGVFYGTTTKYIQKYGCLKRGPGGLPRSINQQNGILGGLSILTKDASKDWSWMNG